MLTFNTAQPRVAGDLGDGHGKGKAEEMEHFHVDESQERGRAAKQSTRRGTESRKGMVENELRKFKGKAVRKQREEIFAWGGGIVPPLPQRSGTHTKHL